MGKISPVSSKYIVNATIEIEGVVDRPDVIGAIFGQTEGLLGADLELRELQRSGRIGRIEVGVETRSNKTVGSITIPSSLDKAETAIVGASLEIIQRIGPCNAKVKVQNIEDVRVSKRTFVIDRAKELLKQLMETVAPDSRELAEEVAHTVRVMEIQEYGRDRLPCGPGIDDSDEVILVEGRADVLNLLKHGFKNVLAMNGTSCPPSVLELCKKKDVVAFVDGDRGGDLILKELINMGEVDFVTRAPDGKEVEELAKKEIHKALRSRITIEQAKLELASHDTSESIRRPLLQKRPPIVQKPLVPQMTPASSPPMPIIPVGLSGEEKEKVCDILDALIGTRGACLLDSKLNVVERLPFSELKPTLKLGTKSPYAVVFDGSIDRELADVASFAKVRHLIGMNSEIKPQEAKISIVTGDEL